MVEERGIATSLIISTYNWKEALRICLESIRKLHQMPDEVIIGDDGSRSDTKALVEKYQKDFPVPLHYIFQPDEGFRLAEIRNKCVARAKGDYIIQIDGDIFLHPDFISDHLREARPDCFLKGGRVQLNEEYSSKILSKGEPSKIHFLSSGIEAKRPNTLRMPVIADLLAPRYRKHRQNVLGCNMSFFRDDFIKVNGYDESFEGWGGEDLDLALRFANAGVNKRYLKFCALAYHLWHPEASKEKSQRNHELAYEHSAGGVIRATVGVDRYIFPNNC